MPNANSLPRSSWPHPAMSPLPHPSWDRILPELNERPQSNLGRLSATEFWNRLGL